MTAPALPEQVDFRLMPRPCPEAARLRLAWYAVCQKMRIVEHPTARQYYDIEQERETEIYRKAKNALSKHIRSCQTCQNKMNEP